VRVASADTSSVNTIAAKTQRIPRPAIIGIVVLVAAFAMLMVVRSGLVVRSNPAKVELPRAVPSPTHVTPSTPAVHTVPKVVLIPGLPAPVAHALRYSNVVVVSLYVGQAHQDRAWVAAARTGARSAGAGFVAVNVGADKPAEQISSFVGTASSPSMFVVKRPGKIVTRISGPADEAVVAQAAHNAGARR
jgi:hypothetical protein